MPTNPAESTFMVAAEKQIDRLLRAVRWQRILIVVIVILVALLALVVWNQHRQELVACQSGNAYKHEDLQNWLYFITIASQGDKNPSDIAKANSIESHIAEQDAPHSCASSWNLLSEGFRR